MAEFGEVDEPPDFLQQVSQRIAAPRKYSVLERLFGRPVMARVLVPIGCLTVVALGAWLVHKRFSSLPPSSVAKHRTEARSEPEVIARAPAKIEPFSMHPTEDVALPAAPRGGTALPLGRFEEGEMSTPSKAEGRSRRERIRATLATTADKENKGALAAKAHDRNAGGIPLKKPAAATEPAPEEAIAETGKRVALSYDFATMNKAGQATVAPRDDAGGTLSEQIGRQPVAGFWGHTRGKEQAADTEDAKPTDAAPVASTQAVAGTRAIAGQPVQGKAAGFKSVGPSEPASQAPLMDSELQRKAPATPGKGAKDKRLEINGDAYADDRLEEAGKEEISFYGAELKALERSQEQKSEAGSFESRNGLRGIQQNGVQTQEGVSSLEAGEAFDINVATDMVLGGASNLERYHALGQAVPELVLTVKDRPKALAEIKKLVKDLSGRLEPLVQRGGELVVVVSVSEADLVLVSLTPAAYKEFNRKFAAPRPSRGLSIIESRLEEVAKATQSRGQREDTVTFLIRLVEITPQGQPQQPSQE